MSDDEDNELEEVSSGFRAEDMSLLKTFKSVHEWGPWWVSSALLTAVVVCLSIALAATAGQVPCICNCNPAPARHTDKEAANIAAVKQLYRAVDTKDAAGITCRLAQGWVGVFGQGCTVVGGARHCASNTTALSPDLFLDLVANSPPPKQELNRTFLADGNTVVALDSSPHHPLPPAAAAADNGGTLAVHTVAEGGSAVLRSVWYGSMA
mmetsp:Transcript_26929/g.53031  ORF Transcript_26929/g.53031 Transcript_26929/m.53031 type:complete len:209 (-) Transcript_26929:224-850(-)